MKQNYNTIAQHLKSLIFGMFIFSVMIGSPVAAQTITLQTPNGGEVWDAGTVEVISWSGQNLSGIIRIEFSPDGGNSWLYCGEVPTAPAGGNASLGVPYFLTGNALLRVYDVTQPEVTDLSDAPFTVLIPAIFIWEPSGNSAVFANSPAQVYWILNVPDITLINAEISTDNGQTFTPVAQNLNAQMSYTYLELSDVPADSCILKLYNAEDPSEYGLSNLFAISPLPVYTLTSPAGGEIVNTYSSFTIAWDVENPYTAYNYLEFSSDNGETWEVIANGAARGNSGSVEWITPNVDSEECLIRITDSYAYSSNDTSAPFTILAYPETPVCMVTVDSLTNQNVIIWEKPVSDLIADFLVYKETDEANVYEVIDTVSYEEAPIVSDFGSNPAMRPYRYKIGFRDSENRVFPAGDYHQTIHLTINQGVNGNWNLIWTPYTGIDYTSYKIMRSSGNGDFEQIASVSASFSSFTDFDAPAGDIAYMVKIVNPEGCNTGLRNAVYTDIYSNQASASPVQVNDPGKTAFNIYPVPANDRISIQFGDNVKGTIRLTLTDVTGRVIYSTEYSDVRQGQVYSVNTSEFNEGIYLLNVISADSRNTRKIVVRH
ncbi:MAG: T9SS type A sorting domain-containing protein [Bacteroidales bacterium]|nr:T9SS type A sorting domain-containing protein [Bacteroidales bacterium]